MRQCIFEVRAQEQAESSVSARAEKFHRATQAMIYSYQQIPTLNFPRFINLLDPMPG
jgi:hypothetical protein